MLGRMSVTCSHSAEWESPCLKTQASLSDITRATMKSKAKQTVMRISLDVELEYHLIGVSLLAPSIHTMTKSFD